MEVISQGNNTYDIFDNSLQVYEKLPAKSSTVKYLMICKRTNKEIHYIL